MGKDDRSDHDKVADEAARLERQRDDREAEMRAETKGTVGHQLAKRKFDASMQELGEFRKFWRQIGEVTGGRTGILVVNNVEG